MWLKGLRLAFARSLVTTLLGVAAERVLASIDHTDKLKPADKEVARGAVLALVQELAKELGNTAE